MVAFTLSRSGVSERGRASLDRISRGRRGRGEDVPEEGLASPSGHSKSAGKSRVVVSSTKRLRTVSASLPKLKKEKKY